MSNFYPTLILTDFTWNLQQRKMNLIFGKQWLLDSRAVALGKKSKRR